MRRLLGLRWLSVGFLAAAACAEPAFTSDMVLGGETVSAVSLNRGRELYMHNCYACHGEQGNGQGPAAAYLRPPPRDFRAGIFKFGLAVNGLPHTQDLVELVQRGLTGTAMLPWDVPKEQLADIINYIKTFSPEFTCVKSAACGEQCTRASADGKAEPTCYKPKALGTRVELVPDPWAGRAPEAIARGKVVYHVNAQCAKCHPAYVTQKEFWDMTRGDLEWAYGELVYRSALRHSGEYRVGVLPIDFLYHPVKTTNAGDTEVSERERMFRVIGAGVNGAAMPTWKGAIPDEDLWALVYYVQSLHRQRGTDEGRALRTALLNQEPFQPPTAETPPPAGEGGSEPL